MPPTDCFDGQDASAAIACGVAELQRELGPAGRSPMHHGTEPDLSASTPLPAGVAAKGLDLSPEGGLAARLGSGRTGAEQLQQVVAAAVSASSSLPARVGRGFTSVSRTEPPSRGAKRTATTPQGSGGGMGSGTAPCTPCTPCREHEMTRGASTPVSATVVLGSPPSYAKNFQTTSTAAPAAAARGGFVKPGCSFSDSFDESREGAREAGEAPPGFDPLVAEAAKPRTNSEGRAAMAGAGISADARGGAGGVGREEAKSGKGINEMMSKAKKAAAHIRLLLHAKRCQGDGCKEPGCDVARQLVAHMRVCGMAGGGSCKPTCVQAHRLLEHYAECSRRRNLGGRYCLVCSLVARSAKSSSKSKSNISARGSHASPSRETRALLGSGTGSARVMGAGCGHRESPTGSVGVASSVGISRLKGGERGQGSPIAGGVGRIGVMGGRQKDGVFFRPLPKARSGSWGGYDRRRLYRRTRFDSIPEDVAEEGVDDDDEASAEGSSEGTDDGSLGSDNRSSISKTLVSSHSL